MGVFWLTVALTGLLRLRCLVELSLIGGSVSSPAATAISTSVAATGYEASPSTMEPSSSKACATATPSSRHAGNVGSLGCYLDVAALEHAIVQDQRLCNQTGLCKLDVGITIAYVVSSYSATEG